MTNNVKQEELPEVYKEIVKEKEPDQFIDLLCANHYFAGQFGNKIPVTEARVAFELWLNTHVNQQVIQALEQARRGAIPCESFQRIDGFGTVHSQQAIPVRVIDNLIKEYKGDKG